MSNKKYRMNTPEEMNNLIIKAYDRYASSNKKDEDWLEKEINELLDGYFDKSPKEVAEEYEIMLSGDIGDLIDEVRKDKREDDE